MEIMWTLHVQFGDKEANFQSGGLDAYTIATLLMLHICTLEASIFITQVEKGFLLYNSHKRYKHAFYSIIGAYSIVVIYTVRVGRTRVRFSMGPLSFRII